MSLHKTILIVDDDESLRDRLARAFTRRGYQAYTAQDYDAALIQIREHSPRFGVFDLRMPGKNGLLLIREAVSLDPDLKIVVLTGYGSIATATEAIKLGAHSYLTKPADANEILLDLESDLSGDLAVDAQDLTPPTLARLEWEHIQRVLKNCGGNISIAARKLGMHRRTLQRKLNKYPPD